MKQNNLKTRAGSRGHSGLARVLALLALLLTTAATGAWAQTYNVKMKSGTVDADKWTIASGEKSATGSDADGLTGLSEGDAVTLTYSGRLKVKSVTATHDGWDGDLSNIPASLIGSDGHTVIVPDGTTLTGTLDGSTTPYKIVIPDGATVTLADVEIYGENNENYKWAGINCEGDATIILADNTTNKVEGFYKNWPGIYVPGDKDDPSKNKTLIIKGGSNGSGNLEAKGRNNSASIGGGKEIACGNIIIKGGNIRAEGGHTAAAIGSGRDSSCGNIIIEGGNIRADGGYDSAGIGSGNDSSCGDITISGGTIEASGEGQTAAIGSGHVGRCGNILINGGIVTANGDVSSAGIGSGCEASCGNITISGGTVTANSSDYGCAIGGGEQASCGDITITKDVTLLTATKGEDSPNSIGLSHSCYGCGTVTIGCELDSEGKPKSGTGTVYYDDDGYQNGGDVYLAQSPLTLVNLGKLKGHYVAPNGTTLFGTLKGSEQPYMVSIADGATVTLDGVNISGVNKISYRWAGLNCKGDATIILNDGSENTVKGFHFYYPGIYVPEGSTLIIKGEAAGTGSLTASPFDGGTSNSYGAGIGGGNELNCGNIKILGGTITATGVSNAAGIGSGGWANCGNITISGGTVNATGGDWAAGIGSGFDGSSCGDITISGGTVEAKGGPFAAGIGSGETPSGSLNPTPSSCGDITITTGVTKVTATKGDHAPNSIGYGDGSSCGTVTIGCTLDGDGKPVGGTVYWNGSFYTSGGQNYLSQCPLIYEPGN